MASGGSTYERVLNAALAAAARTKTITDLPPMLRTVAAVHAAQGIIDNGGLRYFFEADFPGKPPYSIFVNAYRDIGAGDAADSLARAVALFPFDNPHKHLSKRTKFLDRFSETEPENAPVNPFEPLARNLCGNQTVWLKLQQYAESAAQSQFKIG